MASFRCIQNSQLYTMCLENDQACSRRTHCEHRRNGDQRDGERSMMATAKQRGIARRTGAAPAHRGIWAGLAGDARAAPVKDATCEGRQPPGPGLGEEEVCATARDP